MKQDYYETLGVDKNADESTLKSAYRKLAMKYHPDRNQGDEEAEKKFKEVNEAYEVLSNKEKRARYDQFGHAGVDPNAQGGFNQGFEGFSGFEDIFSSFFGGGFESGSAYRNRATKGSNVRVDIELTFKEAINGAEKTLKFQRLEICPSCDGTGAKKGTSLKTCTKCNGRGQMRYSTRTLFGESVSVRECDECDGTGEVFEVKCDTCKGKKKVIKNRKINVKIPKGVDDGTVMTIRSEGSVGSNGGPNGDVLLYIRVKRHKDIIREGFDLYKDIHITIAQAILGDEVIVEGINSKIKLKIDKGTQSNTIKRIPNEGVNRLNSYGKGDFYIKIIVDIPKEIDSKQKEKLYEFSKAMGYEIKKPKNFFEKVKDAIT